jgi:hypothetical protein
MPYIKLIMLVLPYIPDVVRAVELIFGKQTGVSQQKLQTAVSMLQAVVPAVADHLASEPTTKPKLESLISTVVTGINAANTWHETQVSTPQVGG